ncbi:MAG: hypothetical protein AB1445_12940 [Bacillota bacterium]
MLIDAGLFVALESITGDGARELLKACAHSTVQVECGPEVLVDVDTPADYRGFLCPGGMTW